MVVKVEIENLLRARFGKVDQELAGRGAIGAFGFALGIV
jgi:hypothetical protein